jgi:5-methylcytosine-specific restriction protein A
MVSLATKGLALSKRSALRSNGSTTQWRKLREIVIRRDGICQMCGMDGNHVDHIVPRKLGGDDSLNNLQLLCEQCNLRKGGRLFDSNRTPMTPLGSFIPKNASISHYQDDSE